MVKGVKWDEFRGQLLSEGFVELGDFRIELTLDNTFMDIAYIPRIAVYSRGRGKWYVLRNSIKSGNKLDEGWENAVEVLKKIISGDVQPDFNDPDLEMKFVESLRKYVEL
ncbi:hypothetical protein X802_04825 [Thermococcus guaymasensis DSM 11113]|uniref:Uncharacterized protein n=1 Tax=Thermococcus guaymasensis DSM 11113 TaxID=1432656 RepID=A0A0X1KJX6_9EURY|nr:hypothetical protein [Thermococcus guaymasensis]AJC71568.1 hypothetical protein X802_04825 [Thermococcus guaymasensis DSM 11113]